MPLLERDEPMKLLKDCWEAASRGQGNIVSITGEAGIGKTALSMQFLGELGCGHRTFRAGCEDFSIAEPLGPFFDIASQVGWMVPKERGESVGHAVFIDALEAFSVPSEPTAILIEDIHWADEATLDFLRFAARRLPEYPLLFIVTSRDEIVEGRSQLRRAIGEAPSSCLTRLELKPLSFNSVEILSKARGKEPSTVFSLTDGNPYYVSEVLAADLDVVPRSIEDSVLSRANQLDGGARRLLDACSIFPRRTDADVAGSIVGQGIWTSLDHCVSIGLLEADLEHFAFRHELARQAVEATLPWALRVELHGQALDALSSKCGAPKSELLHHALLAGRSDVVGPLASDAAAEAEFLRSNREAAEYYLIAVEHSDNISQPEKVQLLQKCAWANYLVGHYDEAISSQTSAIQLLRFAGDRIAEGDAYRKLSRFQWSASDERFDAEQSAKMAVETLSRHPGPELALAYSNLSQLAMLAWDVEPAVANAEIAVNLAKGLDRDDIVCHALNNLGCSLAWSDPDAGRQYIEDSLNIALRIDDRDGAARAYLNRTDFEFRSNAAKKAIEIGEEGLEFCVKHQLDGYSAYLSGVLAWAQIAAGFWRKAGSTAETTLSLTDDLCRNWDFFPSSIALAQLACRTAWQTDERIEQLLVASKSWTNELQHYWIYAVVVAERAWLESSGEDRAMQILQQAAERAPDPKMIPDVYTWMWRLGGEVASRDRSRLSLPHRLTIEGNWREAAAEWERLELPYNRALALIDGDAGARNSAIEILQQLEAGPVVSKVKTLMQADGMKIKNRGPRRSTKQNPLGLTIRQMDVLKLLDQGLSNNQIADHLFVSPKTVDHHVSAVLAKLEAATRGEAVANARNRGVLLVDNGSELEA